GDEAGVEPAQPASADPASVRQCAEGILLLGGRAEHAGGHRAQVRTLCLELLRQPVACLHVTIPLAISS
ncbi:MAG TPA: hypothetical protein VF493_03215, partial [Terriglobales bacterium]